MSDVDWNDLRYLHVAVQQGSLTRAARALRVRHTTVGRRLDALEDALGASLVIRGPDGLRPTPIGAELVPLLGDIERAVAAACALAGARRSSVRLAAPSGFADLLGDAVAQLRARHPDISVEIVSGARAVDLRRGEADLAVRIGPIDDPDLIARKVGDVGWALYASRRYLARRGRPAGVRDLSGHELIGFDPGLAQSPAARWVEAHARSAAIVLRSREMVDMRDAAKRGVGLALLPCLLGDAEQALERITSEVVARRPIAIVHRRDARRSASVRVVARIVAEAIAAHAAELGGVRDID